MNSTKNLKNTKKIILNWTKLTFLFFNQLSCLTYYVYESSNTVQKRIINYGKKEYKKCLQNVVPCHNAYFPYIIFLSYIVVRFLYAILQRIITNRPGLKWFIFFCSFQRCYGWIISPFLLPIIFLLFSASVTVNLDGITCSMVSPSYHTYTYHHLKTEIYIWVLK